MPPTQFPSFSGEPVSSKTAQTPVVAKTETTEIVPVETPVLERVAATDDWYDIDKLAYAVASHETAMGTTGVGKTLNNVCGIRRNGAFESYASIEEALEDCKSVLLKYKPWSIQQISKKYTTTEQDFWATNVQYFYSK